MSEHVDTIRTFKTSLYDEEAATEARMQLIAGITLPTDPPLCAASIGLLALLEPRARQLQMLHIHPGFAAMPQGLRDAANVAAMVHASGPRLPYDKRVRDILGIDGSYGRIVEPLLELREAIMVARAIREQCIRVINDGFMYGDTAIGGPVGILVELRELGVATNPDLVDEWLATFDRICMDDVEYDEELLREWSVSYRGALELLATEPDQKLLGSDPSSRRTRRTH